MKESELTVANVSRKITSVEKLTRSLFFDARDLRCWLLRWLLVHRDWETEGRSAITMSIHIMFRRTKNSVQKAKLSNWNRIETILNWPEANISFLTCRGEAVRWSFAAVEQTKSEEFGEKCTETVFFRRSNQLMIHRLFGRDAGPHSYKMTRVCAIGWERRGRERDLSLIRLERRLSRESGIVNWERLGSVSTEKGRGQNSSQTVRIGQINT